MQWRAWLGLKPIEAEFVQDLLGNRPDAAAWSYDPQARTLTHPVSRQGAPAKHRSCGCTDSFFIVRIEGLGMGGRCNV
jgi:hypothetical protein